MHVQANDRKAIFVGPEAYMEAGGTIVRDLFTEDRGGYYSHNEADEMTTARVLLQPPLLAVRPMT